MDSPPRARLKKAMLAIFLAKGELKKKQRSKEFTKFLFAYVKAHMRGKSKDEIELMQMQAIGLFSQYIFRKNKEKREEKAKTAKQTFEEIANESDELYDEIESIIIHPA